MKFFLSIHGIRYIRERERERESSIQFKIQINPLGGHQKYMLCSGPTDRPTQFLCKNPTRKQKYIIVVFFQAADKTTLLFIA